MSSKSQIESVNVLHLDNGFSVASNTQRWGAQAVYLPNLKAVVAHLHLLFEGKARLTKDQLSLLKTLGKDGQAGED